MARNVFDASDHTPSPSKPAGNTKMRKALFEAVGGPASAKYIEPSTQSTHDRYVDEIDIGQIRASSIQDRLDLNVDIDKLAESIKADGQQIPIIVRKLETQNPSYEVVVGRRRIAALKRLGRDKVRAFVRTMSEKEAFRVQGLENIQRLETSFIERAMVAQHAMQKGYTATEIADFLNISRSHVSRMASAYSRIGDTLARAIGPAHRIGRRRWDDLADAIATLEIKDTQVIGLIDTDLSDSSDRFEQLENALQAMLPQELQDPPERSEAAHDPEGHINVEDDAHNHVEPYAAPPSDVIPFGVNKSQDGGPVFVPKQDADRTAPKVRKFFRGALKASVTPGKIVIQASSDAPEGLMEEVSAAIDDILTKLSEGGR